jgi:hypothetical protein
MGGAGRRSRGRPQPTHQLSLAAPLARTAHHMPLRRFRPRPAGRPALPCMLRRRPLSCPLMFSSRLICPPSVRPGCCVHVWCVCVGCFACLVYACTQPSARDLLRCAALFHPVPWCNTVARPTSSLFRRFDQQGRQQAARSDRRSGQVAAAQHQSVHRTSQRPATTAPIVYNHQHDPRALASGQGLLGPPLAFWCFWRRTEPPMTVCQQLPAVRVSG